MRRAPSRVLLTFRSDIGPGTFVAAIRNFLGVAIAVQLKHLSNLLLVTADRDQPRRLDDRATDQGVILPSA